MAWTLTDGRSVLTTRSRKGHTPQPQACTWEGRLTNVEVVVVVMVVVVAVDVVVVEDVVEDTVAGVAVMVHHLVITMTEVLHRGITTIEDVTIGTVAEIGTEVETGMEEVPRPGTMTTGPTVAAAAITRTVITLEEAAGTMMTEGMEETGEVERTGTEQVEVIGTLRIAMEGADMALGDPGHPVPTTESRGRGGSTGAGAARTRGRDIERMASRGPLPIQGQLKDFSIIHYI